MKNLSLREYSELGMYLTVFQFSGGSAFLSEISSYLAKIGSRISDLTESYKKGNITEYLENLMDKIKKNSDISFYFFNIGQCMMLLLNQYGAGDTTGTALQLLKTFMSYLNSAGFSIEEQDKIKIEITSIQQSENKTEALDRLKQRIFICADQKEMNQKMIDSKKNIKQINPWISGSFYLVSACVLITLVMILGKLVPLYVFPIALVGGIIIFTIVGALGLRNDEKLSEKVFVELMIESLKYVPFIKHKNK